MKLNEALILACEKYGYSYHIVQGILAIKRGGVNGHNKLKSRQENKEITVM